MGSTAIYLSPGERDLSPTSERCWRFSVRCDRETNQAIAIAAARAGLTATAFVQRHFETILDPAPGADGVAPFVGKPMVEARMARQYGIETGEARMLRYMAYVQRREGRVAGRTPRDIAAQSGCGVTNSYEAIAKLREAGLIHAAPGGGARPVWQVMVEAG